MKNPRADSRSRIYDVLLAVMPLLGLYAGLSEREITLWLALGAAMLGLGMARANVRD